MKSNRDEIFDYIDGSGNNGEAFEKKLNSDPVFAAEYEKIKLELKKIDEGKNIDITDAYYSALLPKVKGRMEKKSIFGRSGLIYSISSVSVVVIVFILFSLNISTVSKSEKILSDLLDNYEYTEVMELLEEESSIADLYSKNEENIDLANTFKDLTASEYGNLEIVNGVSSLYTNYYLDNASDEEVEEIIKLLQSKNYF